METFLYSLAILTISGLGFLTYRHPKTGRQIVLILIISTFILYIFTTVYQQGWHSGFNKSIDILQISIPVVRPKHIDFDSLEIIYKDNPDTLKKIMNQYEDRLLNYSRKTIDIEHTFLKNLFKSESQFRKIINSFFSYYYIAIGILFIFLILTYVFQNLQKQDSVEQNDSAD